MIATAFSPNGTVINASWALQQNMWDPVANLFPELGLYQSLGKGLDTARVLVEQGSPSLFEDTGACSDFPDYAAIAFFDDRRHKDQQILEFVMKEADESQLEYGCEGYQRFGIGLGALGSAAMLQRGYEIACASQSPRRLQVTLIGMIDSAKESGAIDSSRRGPT